jgi:hypothetical protein
MDIIQKNLELMISNEKGGLNHLLQFESFGGNAAYTKDGRSVAAANFYFDNQSGEIKEFGNIQDVNELIKTSSERGLARVALTLKGQEILSVHYIPPGFGSNLENISNTRGLTNIAEQNILNSAKLYNDRYR